MDEVTLCRCTSNSGGGSCTLSGVPVFEVLLIFLQVFSWLGNPSAIARNVRFVDVDLNRQFASAEGEGTQGAAATVSPSEEAARAATLRSLFASHLIDFVIDLHSTNADVGLVAMVPAGSDNVAGLRGRWEGAERCPFHALGHWCSDAGRSRPRHQAARASPSCDGDRLTVVAQLERRCGCPSRPIV